MIGALGRSCYSTVGVCACLLPLIAGTAAGRVARAAQQPRAPIWLCWQPAQRCSLPGFARWRGSWQAASFCSRLEPVVMRRRRSLGTAQAACDPCSIAGAHAVHCTQSRQCEKLKVASTVYCFPHVCPYVCPLQPPCFFMTTILLQKTSHAKTCHASGSIHERLS